MKSKEGRRHCIGKQVGSLHQGRGCYHRDETGPNWHPPALPGPAGFWFGVLGFLLLWKLGLSQVGQAGLELTLLTVFSFTTFSCEAHTFIKTMGHLMSFCIILAQGLG